MQNISLHPGLADKCEIQLGYAIGVANPVSIMVDTFGTGKVSEKTLEGWIKDHIDLRPGAIIDKLQLRNPIYSVTSAYGHFGRESFPWECLDNELLDTLNAIQ